MHNIAPVNLHSSVNVTGVSQCANICPILANLGLSIFRNITSMANSAIWLFVPLYSTGLDCAVFYVPTNTV